jgi:CMP-N-acetylneuraminic acid synthetase
MEGETVICIIPARGQSKRLPRKNILPFNGKPIIAYPIKAALDSRLFSKVIVSSEDDEILSVAREHGAYGVKRPAELSTDKASEIEAYKHVLETEDCEYFCAIYPCAAFVKPEEIKGAFISLRSEDADVCMGVTKYDTHPYQMIMRYSDFYHLRFPELNDDRYPDAWASNGSLYWFRTAAFSETPTYFPARLMIYPTFNIDINTLDDFKKAERVYRECLQKII